MRTRLMIAVSVSAALMAHVIMFSFSRGGMLALALTGLMAFCLIPKKPEHYLVFALACMVLGWVLGILDTYWSASASERLIRSLRYES